MYYPGNEGNEMPKQLFLFSHEEWWMKVCDSIPQEKKSEAVSAVKEMLIAAFETKTRKGGCHGKGEDKKSSSVEDRICLCETIDSISSTP